MRIVFLFLLVISQNVFAEDSMLALKTCGSIFRQLSNDLNNASDEITYQADNHRRSITIYTEKNIYKIELPPVPEPVPGRPRRVDEYFSTQLVLDNKKVFIVREVSGAPLFLSYKPSPRHYRPIQAKDALNKTEKEEFVKSLAWQIENGHVKGRLLAGEDHINFVKEKCGAIKHPVVVDAINRMANSIRKSIQEDTTTNPPAGGTR